MSGRYILPIFCLCLLYLLFASYTRYKYYAGLSNLTEEKNVVLQRYEIQAKTKHTPTSCPMKVNESATGPCSMLCEEAQRLSHQRHSVKMEARKINLFVNWASQVFDFFRGGPDILRKKISKKSCSQLLLSVDRSNNTVNYFLLGLFFLSGGLGFLVYRDCTNYVSSVKTHDM
eukprot:TRINITY_DN9547_c0_g2_i1.p1 TRINITY_DN9547_c0_g2~~TRINITY_DN9547_c0_g2_i1.p1  ORF type:complete len:188 (+),score=29.65 TRINITY_DN9547_c0_g2_i1:47-565(+)